MEEAKAHQLLEITGGPDFSHSGGVDTGLQQSLPVVDLDPRQIVKAEHPAGALLPDHRRNADALIVEELLTEAGCVLRLNPEIQLPQQHPPTLPCHRRPVAPSPPVGVTLKHRRHLLHHLQIQPEQRVEPRPLDLQHHLPATAQAGPVHLGQRGGTQRHGIEVNHLSATGPQLLFQNGLHLLKGKRGNPVLQGRQLRHPAGREDVRACREQLPQLDEGRAQPQQLSGQPARPRLLPRGAIVRSLPTSVGPGLAVPPQEQQQGEDGAPDPQPPQHPTHQERASRARLISAMEARRRSTIS